jgi:hypothetical protein
VRTSIAVVVLLVFVAAAAVALPGAASETTYYRIELSPSGSFVAIGSLVSKGNAVLFHAYPDGKLMSLRKTDVRKISQITAQEAAPPPKKDLVSIRDLAMQGASGAPAAGSSPHPSTAPPAGASHPATAGPAVVPVEGGLAIRAPAPPPPD